MAEIQFTNNSSGDWVTWKPQHKHTITVNPSDNLTSYTSVNTDTATIKMDIMNDLCKEILKEIEKGREDMENKKYDFSKVINRAEKKFLEQIDKEETNKRNEIINADVNYIAAKEKFDAYVDCVQTILKEKCSEETILQNLNSIKSTFRWAERDLLTEESKEKIKSIGEEYTLIRNEYRDKINLVNGLIENIDSFNEGLQLLKEYEII